MKVAEGTVVAVAYMPEHNQPEKKQETGTCDDSGNWGLLTGLKVEELQLSYLSLVYTLTLDLSTIFTLLDLFFESYCASRANSGSVLLH